MAMQHSADRRPAAQPSHDPGDGLALPARIVFFDGVCGFCDRTVSWLFSRDTQKRLWYAPLQGEVAERIRERYPGLLPDDVDTVVLLDFPGTGAEPAGPDVADADRGDPDATIDTPIDAPIGASIDASIETSIDAPIADPAHSPRVRVRSDAILALIAELPPPLRYWRWLRVVPRPLRDAAYRAFAAIRYRVFGKLDACRVPSPDERARFLD